ncbi:MAG: hypothetical protein JEZ06_03120 [Anaerolineaceae bacterium]|nr:hypothetical protein [Anaerolineaceae bacterium]
MQRLPIKQMTLYKHGVGFFTRQDHFEGESIELVFQKEEMNDILKSLTVMDALGKVLGIEYPTPLDQKDLLSGCMVNMRENQSLRDLVTSLRGRRIGLKVNDFDTGKSEKVIGILVGMDETDEFRQITTSHVSILSENDDHVRSFPLELVQSVELIDRQSAEDLRFFLKVVSEQEDTCKIKIHLSPGEHALSLNYLKEAPVWRVSYRLIRDTVETGDGKDCLIMGWGIFDNTLEEDLKDVSLSLVAGMPISFVYDLFEPFTPKRPVIKEEERVAPGPVEFEKSIHKSKPQPGTRREMAAKSLGAFQPAPMVPTQAVADSVIVDTKAKDLGALFQYQITAPVSVGRGQSAMVPILSEKVKAQKELLYNASKLPRHPVATLRMNNDTELTLERGPVTVIEAGQYVGEAVLPLTSSGGEIVVPFAVELGVKVREDYKTSRELHTLKILDHYLLFEEWEIAQRSYQVNNSTQKDQNILIEHSRSQRYELYDSPEPYEKTAESYRFSVDVPAGGETKLVINERVLRKRREDVSNQSYKGLSKYLEQGLIDRPLYDDLVEILKMIDRLKENEVEITELIEERKERFSVQKQFRENMQALSTSGPERDLRANYIKKLKASEQALDQLGKKEDALLKERDRIKGSIKDWLK